MVVALSDGEAVQHGGLAHSSAGGQHPAGIARAAAAAVATEDGDVAYPIALVAAGLCPCKAAVQGHAALEFEGIEDISRRVDAFSHPDFAAGRGRGQGILQIGVGVRPGGAVVGAGRANVHVDYAARLRVQAEGPCVVKGIAWRFKVAVPDKFAIRCGSAAGRHSKDGQNHHCYQYSRFHSPSPLHSLGDPTSEFSLDKAIYTPGLATMQVRSGKVVALLRSRCAVC